MTRVRIARPVVDDVLAHARRVLPDECCGLLIGTADRILEARPARNLRASPTRYLVDPADHFAALREARGRGADVIGAYHSHPASAPEPSATDRAEALDAFVYLIVNAASGEVALYRLDAGAFDRLPLEVDGE